MESAPPGLHEPLSAIERIEPLGWSSHTQLRGSPLLEVVLGDGTGRVWTPWDDGLADSGRSWGMSATDLADVDGETVRTVIPSPFSITGGVTAAHNRTRLINPDSRRTPSLP